MHRIAPPLLVVALLGATCAAFVLTEARAQVPSPIARAEAGVPVGAAVGPPLFSPLCSCARDRMRIRFLLRAAERVTVTIRRGDEVVDTLVQGRTYPRGWVTLDWDGIEPSGIVAADGVYRPAVRLGGQHRTIVLPVPIRVDVTPPRVAAVQAAPRVLSPDGDGRGDRLTLRFRARRRAVGLLLVDGAAVARTARPRLEGTLHFDGRRDGKPLATGAHALAFQLEDAAGNRSRPVRLGTLTIRYVALARRLVSVGPGKRFYIRVSSDARTVRWRFAGRSGTARPGTMVLRAPRTTGSYRLSVFAAGHAAGARVKVERLG